MTRPDRLPQLGSARWPEVDAADRRALLVPLGSLEQHGPHLPLDTDTTIATALATELHQARDGTGLAPAMPYGASGEHAAFPGTVSIGTEALTTLLIELIRDATRDWNSVLLVNGHGGNVDAISAALRTASSEGRLADVVHAAFPGADAHAGRTETSVLLHLTPDRVRLDLATAGNTEPLPQLLGRLREEGVRAISPTGVLGDPTGATPAEGAALMAAAITRALPVLDRLLAATAAT